MTNIEATRLAIVQLGSEATTNDIIRHAAEHHGLRLEARFVPIYRAAVKAEEKRQEMWVIAAQVAEEDRRNLPVKRRKTASQPG
ncbi:hypothetical protein [Zavarzinella formosa]|uniref:hypothetical protein n=1 Tax=Zavarzinella formosa TaxID=360055 RepID=UPI0002FD785E|nr:hypothetical protein [Zavarzinella formosa]